MFLERSAGAQTCKLAQSAQCIAHSSTAVVAFLGMLPYPCILQTQNACAHSHRIVCVCVCCNAAQVCAACHSLEYIHRHMLQAQHARVHSRRVFSALLLHRCCALSHTAGVCCLPQHGVHPLP